MCDRRSIEERESGHEGVVGGLRPLVSGVGGHGLLGCERVEITLVEKGGGVGGGGLGLRLEVASPAWWHLVEPLSIFLRLTSSLRPKTSATRLDRWVTQEIRPGQLASHVVYLLSVRVAVCDRVPYIIANYVKNVNMTQVWIHLHVIHNY